MLVASDLWIRPLSRYLISWFVALFSQSQQLQMRLDTLNTDTHVMPECYALLIVRNTDWANFLQEN
ncbi:MAG TPA: hypothetical protein DCX10_03945 [Verrucomicrobiales bacterium]|nr:hypothetical protein [Verrucomicrobiales bacterium]